MNELQRLTSNFMVTFLHFAKMEREEWEEGNPGEPFTIGHRPGISERKFEYLEDEARSILKKLEEGKYETLRTTSL